MDRCPIVHEISPYQQLLVGKVYDKGTLELVMDVESIEK